MEEVAAVGLGSSETPNIPSLREDLFRQPCDTWLLG